MRLMQIDMEYRTIYRKKEELESKEELTESETLELENINHYINEKLGTIGYNLDGVGNWKK